MIPSTAPTNRFALLSFITAGLTISAFCAGVVPIPLTGWVCYPTAVLLGSTALLTGFRALRQVRASGEKGRGLALLGIWTGALTILVALCFMALSIVFIYYSAETINRLWPRFNP